MYDHTTIEEKWLKSWGKQDLFQDLARSDLQGKEKLYLLYAFAYPSGSGLHVGHVEPKTALDILARYYRMRDKQVFFPVGWDAFGLPAENYAVKTGVPPASTTKQAIHTFRRQVKRLGISYDWAGEIATSHPEYYRWTQWLFLQLYQEGLAYKAPGIVNWCPSCQTVLANEQVVEGACERCDTQVIQRELDQWYFKITAYQDELISGLDQVDWPEPTKQQQLNWIGKSEGLKERWQVKDLEIELESFTTWPHTTWGATFIVVAPEHPVVQDLIKGTGRAEEVNAFCQRIINQKAGGAIVKSKEGIFTGRYAINPLTGWEMPIYVANFAIMSYGTGIVKACPAHDERDFEFAKKYDLPIKRVIDSGDPNQGELYVGEGKMVNAGDLTGMTTTDAREKIIKQAIEKGYGEEMTTYKLRDWLISRQRYWGAPIPIVYDPEGKPHPVKVEHLPWRLPTDVDFKPTGESPLKSSQEFFARVEKLYGKGWTPEVDTMDTFVDSSWYYLRYADPRNNQEFAAKSQLEKWLPVDFYMIGPEHIVLHLLYSRFFTKFLRDQGYLNFDEPFLKMRHQGMILGPDHKKMSKSKGNVINPDEIISKFGADTLRVYEMFMGPIDADKPWDARAVVGVYKFLGRVKQLVETSREEAQVNQQLLRQLHQTIVKVGADIEQLKFNTAIAAMMKLVNAWEKAGAATLDQPAVDMFVRLLAPFAPFLAEELYQSLNGESVHLAQWPEADPALAKDLEIILPIQVNGKLRAELVLSPDMIEKRDEILAQAAEHPRVMSYLEGREIKKQIYVAGKIINFVV